MQHLCLCLALVLGSGADQVETRFDQVHPVPRPMDGMARTPGKSRAIVLVHGLTPHVINNQKVHQALLHGWQLPDSVLVKMLAKEGDVYAFAYGQNLPLDIIHETPGLTGNIRKLRFMGYEEIVLVGHSAGGMIARHFVEDFPNFGVTKVIQVCSPNIGSGLAKIDLVVRKDQEPFLNSLTKAERLKCLERRGQKRIPADIDFVCVVGASGPLGDGLVSPISQWSDDLQKQGIPALRVATSHFSVMRSQKTAEKICELVRVHHPRWAEEQLGAMRKSILFGIP